jgi:N-acyl-D-aspartate/D-glutamate deacylase
VTWENRLVPSSSHGVTTVVMGNCGVGFAPCRPEHRDLLIRLMEGVEDIPNPALVEGVPWRWESHAESSIVPATAGRRRATRRLRKN